MKVPQKLLENSVQNMEENQTGISEELLTNLKNVVHYRMKSTHRSGHSEGNMAAVSAVAEDPNTSDRHRSQQLNIKKRLYSIFKVTS